MKRLFLLRHAKAGFGPRDQTRPLSERGKRDAFWLGQYLKRENLLPGHILCSSAVRAQESLSRLLEGAEMVIPASFCEDLYLASADHMMNQLQNLAPDIKAPMIIGHNPGLCLLFQSLAGRSLKYPTCMTTILDFDIDIWSDLKSNSGQLLDVILPADNQQITD